MQANFKLLIREVKRKRSRHLDLSGQELTHLPAEVAELTFLVSLDLSRNLLAKIDESIAELKSLESIDLSKNRLEEVPSCLCLLPKLSLLKLAGNPLRGEFEKALFLTDFSEIRSVLDANANQRDIFGDLTNAGVSRPFSSTAPKTKMPLPSSEPLQKPKSAYPQSNFSESQKPSFESQKLAFESQKPAFETQKPSTDSQKNISDSKKSQFRLPTELCVENPSFSNTEALSQGGFAVVERAKWLGCPVAVKKFMNGPGEETLAEFQAELRALARVRHPCVVNLMGYSISPQKLLIFENIEGISLHQALKAKKLPFAKQSFLLDLARTLSFINLRGVVHCDIKPLNILLSHQNRPVVIDFGLARILNEAPAVKASTPAYAAPELLFNANSSEITEKVDVWAFGVVFWEICTNKRPFEELDAGSIKKILAEKKVGSYLGCGGLTSSVEEIVKACLRFEAKARPQMEEVARMIEKVGDIA